MNLLILGDVMGASGREVLKNKLPKIIYYYLPKCILVYINDS